MTLETNTNTSQSSSDNFVCLVPVAEVERLWFRFQQLGLNDTQTLPSETFQQHPYTTDPLVRQVNLFFLLIFF